MRQRQRILSLLAWDIHMGDQVRPPVSGMQMLVQLQVDQILKSGSRPSTWWKLCVVEVALDHAATVAICVGTASMTGVAISAIASVCI